MKTEDGSKFSDGELLEGVDLWLTTSKGYVRFVEDAR